MSFLPLPHPCHGWSHFWDPLLYIVWRHIFCNFTLETIKLKQQKCDVTKFRIPPPSLSHNVTLSRPPSAPLNVWRNLWMPPYGNMEIISRPLLSCCQQNVGAELQISADICSLLQWLPDWLISMLLISRSGLAEGNVWILKIKIRNWTGIWTSDLQTSSLALYHFSYPGSNDDTGLNLLL